MSSEKDRPAAFPLRTVIAGVLGFTGFYLLSRNDYLLFHSLVELLGVAVAFGVFIFAWNTRRFLNNDYLLFIGIGFLFVSFIGTLHTLSYRGMGVFQDYEPTNLAAQLWIAARYLQSVTLLMAPLFIHRRLNTNLAFGGFAVVTGLVVVSVLVWQNFPTTFIVGQGLTPFKVASEFIISGILLGAIWLLYRNRKEFSGGMVKYLTAAMVVNIAAEMAFTLYSDAYGFFNALGHFLLIVSIYFIYKALIEIGLSRPFDLLFRDLKKSEESLKERAGELRRYELLAGNSRDIILMVRHEDGRIVEANAAATAAYGYSRDELLVMTIQDLRAADTRSLTAAQMAEASEKGILFETVHRRKNGSTFPVEVSSRGATIEGERLLLSVIRDITDRKKAEEALLQSEQKYRIVADFTHDWEYWVDTSGRFIYMSPSCERLTGYSRDKFISDPSLNARIIHPEDRGRMMAHFAEVLTGVDPGEMEYRIIRQDGQERWFSHICQPALDDQGWLLGRRVSSRDITERKQAEANQALLTGILKILNRRDSLHPIIADTLRLIRDATGFDAVGLRLRQGDDCPYFLVDGFSDEFRREENFLCPRGGDGAIIRDAEGRAVLECTCGLVMSGRTDPSMSCFTPGGSFWTNVSSELLALPPEADPRTNPRNRCIHTGYESVGLFPVLGGTEIIGLLQLNDRRPGQFTPEQVSFFEGISQNIGLALQRVAAEEALSQSEEKYRLLWSSGNDAVFFLDENNCFVEVNNRTCEVLGYSREELLKMGTRDIDDPTIQIDQAAIQEQLRAKGHALFEQVHLTRDGRRIQVELNAKPILVAGRTMYLSVARDITERKKAEVEREKLLKQVEDQRRLLKNTLDQLPSGVVIRDAAGNLVMGNAEVVRIFGPLPQHISTFDARCCYHKNGRQYRLEEWPMIRTVTRGETVYNEEIEIARDNGDRMTVLASTAPVCADLGEILAYVGVFRDITERKQIEKQVEILSRFPAENPNPVLRVTAQGILLYANSACDHVLGCWHTLVGGGLPAGLRDVIAETLRSGKDKNVEVDCDGVIYSFAFTPIREFNYVNLYGRDISDRKRAEQALQKLNAELEDRVEERTHDLETAHTKLLEQLEFRAQAEASLRSLSSRLLSIQEEERRAIARELHDQTGQSLTVLKLMVGRADRGAPEGLKPLLKDVADMTTEIIKQVRSLSLSLRPGVLDDLGLVPAMDWLFKQLHAQADLRVHFDHDGTSGLSSDINTAVYRITQEALTNIMRHAGVKEAWVGLSSQNSELSLRVEDRGRGFDSSATEAQRSTGLSAMRERAALLGGSCHIESSPGKGTVITISLPLPNHIT